MILPKKVGSRFQMDLIEMPYSQGYRYILRVVDHMSCFGYVAPVKFKEAEEIGTQVVKIISTSIAPQILQFDNGREVSISSFYCCQFECDFTFCLYCYILNVTLLSVYTVTNNIYPPILYIYI